MSLLRRIEKLETARKKGSDAATLMKIEAFERELAAMSDAELDALIARGEAEPCEPEWEARLTKMSNEELYRVIVGGTVK